MAEIILPEQQETLPSLNLPVPIEGRFSCQNSDAPEQLYIISRKLDPYPYDVDSGSPDPFKIDVLDSSTCTRVVVWPIPDELEERVIPSASVYGDRIDYLRRVGHEDGIELIASSYDDFHLFIETTPHARKASLVLTDSGNLRAVWKGDDGDHIGIQFHGSGIGSYVIFKRRPSAPEISRSYGKDTLDGVRKQFSVFNLQI